MKINTVQCKSVLTKSKLPEVDYCINPYIGCLHGCVYCYARFMRRFTGHTEDRWGEFVDVKINAPEVLEKELSRKPKRGVVLLGSVTDAYQPIEEKYQLTRRILEVLLKIDYPISILTKSDLVTRDIDLLKQFTVCEVGLTVTTLDEKISRDFEPRASIPDKRLKALQEIHNAGIVTYVFIGPILPELTDISAILSAVCGKVNYVMAESLNPKCGNWDEIVEIIKNKYPDILPLYKNKFSKGYWDKVERKAKDLCQKYQIPLKGFYRH